MCLYPTIDLPATGKNILRLRKERGLSVKDLQSFFGFEDPQAIYKWQWGKCLPSVDNLYALSALLEVPMNEILVSSRPTIDLMVCEQQAEACCSHFYRSAAPDAAEHESSLNHFDRRFRPAPPKAAHRDQGGGLFLWAAQWPTVSSFKLVRDGDVRCGSARQRIWGYRVHEAASGAGRGTECFLSQTRVMYQVSISAQYFLCAALWFICT